MPYSSKPKARKRFKNKQERLYEYCDITALGAMVDHREFKRMIEEAQFIPRIIEVCRRTAETKFYYFHFRGSSQSLADFEEDFHRRAVFLQEHLTNWLFQFINVLALEACFVSQGQPISKLSVKRLYEIIFVEREFGGPPLKDGRNEVWDTPTLRLLLGEIVSEIGNEGSLTLENVARKINAIKEPIFDGKRKTPLTGKHLQKILRDRRIDWKQLKNDYREMLNRRK